MVCMYNETLLSHKKDEILSFTTTPVDLKGFTPSEVSQRKMLYDIP